MSKDHHDLHHVYSMLVYNVITTLHAKHDEYHNIYQEYNSTCQPPTNAVTPLILQDRWSVCKRILIVPSLSLVEVSFRIDTVYNVLLFIEGALKQN